MDPQTREDLISTLEMAREHWSWRDCIQVCMMAGIFGYANRHFYAHTEEISQRIENVFAALGFADLQEGYAWNDASGRTRAEVVALVEGVLARELVSA